ncbi:hypothetical protein [Pedobacter insulae]|uniref:Uncharacterized protein n=1 Tax=Pedobacter insulae TaxID=414048 RepID=A0A1I2ZIR0_9SPHI|nr:hypothetical protein [Pedobacter insulae]SFH37456.1 hypothetical protein SAMN04489864_11044 [Pedobacter insulae]
MKPIENLSNVEKASLLFGLFPKEMPELIKFIHGMSLAMLEDEERQRQAWDNGLMTYDFWLSLVRDGKVKVERYGKKLCLNGRLFSEQLFDGYIAVFTTHCMEVYITARQHENARFVLAVKMLFNL